MNIVLRHTEYLMTMHDCVVIPGFGAMLRRRRASYCDAQGRLVPPGHSYAFNSALVEDDGLLVSSVARAEALGYSRAAERVACDVDAMLRLLRENGRIVMGRLGEVTLDSETGAMQYEAPAVDTLTPMADWLPVVARPVEDEAEEKTSARQQKPEQGGFARRFVRVARTAAAVAAVAAVAIVCSTPIEVGNAGFASTALPAVTAPREAYVPSARVSAMEIVVDGRGAEAIDTAARSAWQREHIAAMAENQNSIETTDARKNEPKDASARLNDNDRFVVVVATHRTLKAAETTSAQYTGTFGCKTRIVRHGKVWFVVAASTRTREEAVAALRTPDIKRFKDAWVAEMN